MKTITVEVTQEDINNGILFTGDNCPIALAMRRICNVSIIVTIRDVQTLRTYTPLCDLPDIARAFIKAFDKREKVQPFTFTVEIDEGYLA